MPAKMQVLAIDQGTTNTKALVIDNSGKISAKASAPCQTTYPQPGWAEQSAEDIWASTCKVVNDVVAQVGVNAISGIGISNQRETIIAWDRDTGQAVGPAILWQCRRTSAICARLFDKGCEEEVKALTGLGINPLFPASKLAWLIENRPQAQELLHKDQLCVGTVDTWLLWKLTAGKSFSTDHSNASRTLLFDTQKLDWSPRLGELFNVPLSCLPEPMPSDSCFGKTADGVTALPIGIPIHAIMGDSHAALYGHGVRTPGAVKATYGTGSSLMALTPVRMTSHHGLSSTIAWTVKGQTAYAVEGNITVSAHAAAFAAKLMGIPDVAGLSDLAQTVEDSDGVTFVPALAGLGAPHWDDAARGTIAGLTLGSSPAHVARATFDAIVHQIADVFDAMEQDVGHQLDTLRGDGGASANEWLMQLQADVLGRTVQRSELAEVGAVGVASAAFEALGQPMSMTAESYTEFTPKLSEADRQDHRADWRKAVLQARFGGH